VPNGAGKHSPGDLHPGRAQARDQRGQMTGGWAVASASMHQAPGTDGDFLVAFNATFIQVTSEFHPPLLSTLHASSNVLLIRAFTG
jgi:hypothetical protein